MKSPKARNRRRSALKTAGIALGVGLVGYGIYTGRKYYKAIKIFSQYYENYIYRSSYENSLRDTKGVINISFELDKIPGREIDKETFIYLNQTLFENFFNAESREPNYRMHRFTDEEKNNGEVSNIIERFERIRQLVRNYFQAAVFI